MKFKNLNIIKIHLLGGIWHVSLALVVYSCLARKGVDLGEDNVYATTSVCYSRKQWIGEQGDKWVARVGMTALWIGECRDVAVAMRWIVCPVQ